MNTFPKINRLPPELLASIPYFLESYKDIINTTHVCRHWRDTIIASPPLWSCLDNETMHEDLVAACIDRCGSTPLDVTFNRCPGTSNTRFLEKVVLHSSHIRKIRFPSLPWCRIAELSKAFEAPLPLLREVDLGICCCIMVPPLFEQPFLAGAINLVSLSLHDATSQSGTLLHLAIPTLTHLTLLFYEPRIPSVGELLELLRASPLLEDLWIGADAVLDTSDEDSPFPDRFQPVDLPCLRSMRLSWTTLRSQYTFLAHLHYPSDSAISVDVRSQSDVAQPPQSVFPTSWEVFSLPDLSSVTLQMKREQQSTQCAVVAKMANGGSVWVSHSQNVERFVFLNGVGDLIREPSRDRDDNHVLLEAVEFVKKLPIQSIREFSLRELKPDEMSEPESFEIPPELIKLICSDLPNLTTLSLIETCVSELFDILTPLPLPPMYIADLFDSDDTPEWSLPCPSLKVLEVRHPEWIASRHCREAVAMAKARKDENAPLDKASFCSPSVPKSMATGMSLYVGDVDIKKCEWCEWG